MEKPIEQEPAYRLGRALAIIESLLEIDDITKNYIHTPKEKTKLYHTLLVNEPELILLLLLT